MNHILVQDKLYADYFKQQQQHASKPSLLGRFFKKFAT